MEEIVSLPSSRNGSISSESDAPLEFPVEGSIEQESINEISNGNSASEQGTIYLIWGSVSNLTSLLASSLSSFGTSWNPSELCEPDDGLSVQSSEEPAPQRLNHQTTPENCSHTDAILPQETSPNQSGVAEFILNLESISSPSNDPASLPLIAQAAPESHDSQTTNSNEDRDRETFEQRVEFPQHDNSMEQLMNRFVSTYSCRALDLLGPLIPMLSSLILLYMNLQEQLNFTAILVTVLGFTVILMNFIQYFLETKPLWNKIQRLVYMVQKFGLGIFLILFRFGFNEWQWAHSKYLSRAYYCLDIAVGIEILNTVSAGFLTRTSYSKRKDCLIYCSCYALFAGWYFFHMTPSQGWLAVINHISVALGVLAALALGLAHTTEKLYKAYKSPRYMD